MTNSPSESIYARAYNPVLQASIIFAIAFAITLVAKLVNLTGLVEVSDRFPRMTSAAFMLIFAIFNSLFSLSTKDLMKYWSRSLYSFLGLAFISAGSAYLFSAIPIGEAGSYRWIFIVVAIGYLVFLSLMSFMRKIVEFAQREEWNQPRKRR